MDSYASDAGVRDGVKDLMKKMTAGWVTLGAAFGGAGVAFASEIEEIAEKFGPMGNVSYTTFLKGI